MVYLKTAGLSVQISIWVRVGLGWVGLEFDKKYFGEGHFRMLKAMLEAILLLRGENKVNQPKLG